MDLKMKKRSGSKTSLELGRQGMLPPLMARPTTTNFHPLPNYMKSTTSSDARREQANVRLNNNVTKTSSGMRTLMRRTPDVLAKNLKMGRATTESEGTSGVRVCPYSRCSLNRHVHALLPPLKSFVSARRQRGIKLRCQSPKARPAEGSQDCAKLIGRDEAATSKGKLDGEMRRDIDPRSSSQSSDVDREKGKLYSTYLVDDSECTSMMKEESGEQGCKIITCAEFVMSSDDRLGNFFDEISADEVSQECFDEESLNSEAPAGENNFLFDTRHQNGETTMCWNAMDGEEHDLKHESLPNEDPTREIGNQAPRLLDGPAEETTTLDDSDTCKIIKLDQASNQTSSGETNGSSAKYPNNIDNLQDYVENVCNQAENCSEAECNVVHEMNSRNMEMSETEDKCSIQATVKCEKSNQEADELTRCNPRELHFLPLEPDPEAEKVNLRHQKLDARKNADEWMVDYALREAVTKIGPARQRKVASLVEAFERVLPTSKS